MTDSNNRGAGRPREFELEDAVASALEAFWARGVSDVSVADLEDATGVIRTSLYKAFGNKRGLFEAALDRYLNDLFALINGMLTDAAGGLDDIHQFFNGLEAALTDSTQGCFMVNCMVEFGDSDSVVSERGSEYVATLTKGFRSALTRAKKTGEIPPSVSVEATADQLTLQALGLNLAVRIAPDPARIQQLFEATYERIRTL
jgi:TetR/AcrR family transcriptional repressor of nem operon